MNELLTFDKILEHLFEWTVLTLLFFLKATIFICLLSAMNDQRTSSTNAQLIHLQMKYSGPVFDWEEMKDSIRQINRFIQDTIPISVESWIAAINRIWRWKDSQLVYICIGIILAERIIVITIINEWTIRFVWIHLHLYFSRFLNKWCIFFWLLLSL